MQMKIIIIYLLLLLLYYYLSPEALKVLNGKSKVPIFFFFLIIIILFLKKQNIFLPQIFQMGDLGFKVRYFKSTSKTRRRVRALQQSTSLKPSTRKP